MGFRLIPGLLLGCSEPETTKSAEAPDPYVRLDGVDYDSFGSALSDALDDSIIEFCGTRDGPFARENELQRLTIIGCDSVYAVLDGHHTGSVLSVEVEELYLSDLALTRGFSDATLYREGEDMTSDTYAYHPAAVDGVEALLRMDRCTVSRSLRGNSDLAIGISVHRGTLGVGDAIGGRLEGSDSRIVENFVEESEPQNSVPRALPLRWNVSAAVPEQVVDVNGWYWGDGADENGGADVYGFLGEAADSAWNLHGTVSVYCDEGAGCSFEEH